MREEAVDHRRPVCGSYRPPPVGEARAGTPGGMWMEEVASRCVKGGATVGQPGVTASQPKGWGVRARRGGGRSCLPVHDEPSVVCRRVTSDEGYPGWR